MNSDYPRFSEEYSGGSDSVNEETKEEVGGFDNSDFDVVPLSKTKAKADDNIKNAAIGSGSSSVSGGGGVGGVKNAAGANSSGNKNSKNDSNNAQDSSGGGGGSGGGDKPTKKIKLYQSGRLKGYITLALASVINYDAARRSDDAIGTTVISGSLTQGNYAQAVGFISLIVAGISSIIHLDQCSPLKDKVWHKIFGPQSKLELCLISFLVFWWSIATVIQTSVRGIAGDGKQQYNLYFSTWCCCYITLWMLERWLVTVGLSSFKSFIASWPYRAPGWIAINVLSLFALGWYIDLYLNHQAIIRNEEIEAQQSQQSSYSLSSSQSDTTVVSSGSGPKSLYQHFTDIHLSQWQWLLFVGAITYIPSLFFVMVEVFREAKPTNAADMSDHDEHDSSSKKKKKSKQGASSKKDGSNKAKKSVTVQQPEQHRDSGGGGGSGGSSTGKKSLLSSSAANSAGGGGTDIKGGDTNGVGGSSPSSPQSASPKPLTSLTSPTSVTAASYSIYSDQYLGGKGSVENIVEGFCLLVLVLTWIPTVIVATAPGGAASLVGNAYFFTWATTIFVMETFIWFIHDLRHNVHLILKEKENEYKLKQLEVLRQTKELQKQKKEQLRRKSFNNKGKKKRGQQDKMMMTAVDEEYYGYYDTEGNPYDDDEMMMDAYIGANRTLRQNQHQGDHRRGGGGRRHGGGGGGDADSTANDDVTAMGFDDFTTLSGSARQFNDYSSAFDDDLTTMSNNKIQLMNNLSSSSNHGRRTRINSASESNDDHHHGSTQFFEADDDDLDI